MDTKNNYNQAPVPGGEALVETSAPGHSAEERATKITPEAVVINTEKFKQDTQEKITAFLAQLENYEPTSLPAVDTEQAQFLIHHLAQGLEHEDITTQMNRYFDIVKLCLQVKDRELYREYTEKLRALTAQAESEAHTVEESTERINQLIRNSL